MPLWLRRCSNGVCGVSSLHHPNASINAPLSLLVAPVHACVLRHGAMEAQFMQDLCNPSIMVVSIVPVQIPFLSKHLARTSFHINTLHWESVAR